MMKWSRSAARGRKSQKMFEKGFIAHLERDKGCSQIKVTCCSVFLSPDDLWTAEGLQDCGADDQYVCNSSDRWDDTPESVWQVGWQENVKKCCWLEEQDDPDVTVSLSLFYLFKNKVCVCHYAFERRESKKWVFKEFQTFRMNHHDTVVKNKPFPCYSPVLRFYLCRNSSIMHKHPKSTREIMFCADNVAHQRSTLDRFLFKNTHYHLVDSTHSSTTCVPKVSQTFRVFVQTLEGVQVNLGTPLF